MILISFVTDLVYIITTEKKTISPETDFAFENVLDHWRVNSSITCSHFPIQRHNVTRRWNQMRRTRLKYSY